MMSKEDKRNEQRRDDGKKRPFPSQLTNVTVSVIGHVDGGKTTLTSAITGKEKIEIARSKEEIKRAITIQVAYVSAIYGNYHLSFSDCPGHLDLINNIYSGLSHSDIAILLIAINEGVQPATYIHSRFVKTMGVKRMILVFNKFDEEHNEMILMEVKMEAEALLEEHGYKESDGTLTIVEASAKAMRLVDTDMPLIVGQNGELIQSEKKRKEEDQSEYNQILQAHGQDFINKYAIEAKKKIIEALKMEPVRQNETRENFLMIVSDAQLIQGRGTVLTGTIQSGLISEGDTVVLYAKKRGHKPLKGVVTSIESYKMTMKEAKESNNVGMLIKMEGNEKVTKDQIRSGDILVTGKSVISTKKLLAKINITNQSFELTAKPQIMMFGDRVTCSIRALIDGSGNVMSSIVANTDNVCALIELEKPVVLPAGCQPTSNLSLSISREPFAIGKLGDPELLASNESKLVASLSKAKGKNATEEDSCDTISLLRKLVEHIRIK